MTIRSPFGSTASQSVELIRLETPRLRLLLCSYGARINELHVPDRRGAWANIVTGFESLDEYVNTRQYFGCTIGRVANRIAGAAFELDGKRYELAANNGKNNLHGGPQGFDRCVWNIAACTETSVTFARVSPHLESGFPGNLRVETRFSIEEGNELLIEYRAETDQPTPVNLTNHAYFNLRGVGNGTIREHVLTLRAAHITPVNAELIPTGELAPVGGTPFDFRKAKPVGPSLDQVPGAFDHNFVLENPESSGAIELHDPESGRTLQISTSQPGVQLYSGNSFDGSMKGIGGAYQKHSSLCLETQHFPDAIHQPQFPSTLLKPGAVYRHWARWKFTTR